MSDVWLFGVFVPVLFLRRSACTGDIDNETLCANECENERDDNNPKKFNVVRYIDCRITHYVSEDEVPDCPND